MDSKLNNYQDKFLKELKALLKKYNVELGCDRDEYWIFSNNAKYDSEEFIYLDIQDIYDEITLLSL